MFWVIQEDKFIENRYWDILCVLERFSIPYQIVQVGAGKILTPEITEEGQIITNGSVMLSKIARERGWTPGGFLNDNFTYEIWHPIFQDYLINRDVTFTTVGEAEPIGDRFFVRPLLDDKSFTGKVLIRDEFDDWKKTLSADLRILMAPEKHIGQEHRHYIVDGEVITSSRYKLNGEANHHPLVDQYIVDFAQQMAEIWTPARAFVLDTYISDTEIGIVEMGCIGNAGLYQCDVQRLIMALDSMQ